MIKQRIDQLSERLSSSLPKFFQMEERNVWGFSDGEKKLIIESLTKCLEQLEAQPQLLKAQKARIELRKKNNQEWVESIEIIESLWDRNTTYIKMADRYLENLPYAKNPDRPYYFEEIRNIALTLCKYVHDFQACLDVLDVKGARSILNEIREYEWLDINEVGTKKVASDYYQDKEQLSEVSTVVGELEKKLSEQVVSSIAEIMTPLTTRQELSDISTCKTDTFNEALQRIRFLKQVIENNDVYKVFYYKDQFAKRELVLQLLFRLTWYSSELDVNSEVDNGRGPVDYKISSGNADKTLVEFKLASNSKLKQNLLNQVEIYEAANETQKSIKVILYFDDRERKKVFKILEDLGLNEGDTLVTIDARPNKDSASNVK